MKQEIYVHADIFVSLWWNNLNGDPPTTSC
jgi:hypothetical protein